jgi:pimeloyl-[acyl-carrier protein] methyl ester esterase
MSLRIETSGSGPALVLLHGWGLNSLIWESILPLLTDAFTVVRIDLPGHGASSWPPGFHDAESLAALLAPHVPPGCALLGWSLGGVAAIELALAGRARIGQLILVSTTPKFVASDDWEHGLAAPAVERFASLLETDYESTVREFFGLQVQGDEHARGTLRELRQKLLAGGKPRLEALRAGLAILRTADQRDRLGRIAHPTLVIAGQYDRMTSPQAARALAAGIPGARFESIARAGHAPFLSHPGEFCRVLGAFLGRAARATGT